MSPLPCLHCLLPEPFPPPLQVLVRFQPSQQVPSPTDKIQPTVPAAFPAQVVRAGTEGQPDLASSLSDGSTGVGACRSSSRREQQWPQQQSCNTATGTPLPSSVMVFAASVTDM